MHLDSQWMIWHFLYEDAPPPPSPDGFRDVGGNNTASECSWLCAQIMPHGQGLSLSPFKAISPLLHGEHML